MKRAFDFLVSIVLLLISLPIFIVVSLAVFFFLGRPILYSQWRSGLNGNIFIMYKFRSMKNTSDSSGALMPDEARLTRFGSFLRSTSLDELPELWNVLKGEMSLVGPRPLLVDYLPLYSEHQMRRHETKPGITGWAQINGRNTISWEEKFNLDVWYVDNRSFWLDIKILFMTLVKVLKREGISSDNKITMPPFTGNFDKD